jgi:hypothetical protein
MVETNNSTSSIPGTLAILGTAGVFVSNSGNFTNNGTLQSDPNGKLILGADNVTEGIDNESNINLIYNGSGTSTRLPWAPSAPPGRCWGSALFPVMPAKTTC